MGSTSKYHNIELRNKLEVRLEVLQERLDADLTLLAPVYAELNKARLPSFRSSDDAFEVSCAAYRQSQRAALEAALVELKRDFIKDGT